MVARRKPRNGVHAYVVFPAGSLAAVDALDHAAALTNRAGGTDTLCIPLEVVFTSTYQGATKVTVQNPKTKKEESIDVAPGDTIYIKNDPTGGGQSLHFHEYFRVLETGTRVLRSHELQISCDSTGRMVPRPGTAGMPIGSPMTGMVMHPLSPRADCGATNWP
jgi:hypothetical protein